MHQWRSIKSHQRPCQKQVRVQLSGAKKGVNVVRVLTPLFGLLAIQPNQSVLATRTNQHQVKHQMGNDQIRGRNSHVRYESLKFVRDAHPGAVIGSESALWQGRLARVQFRRSPHVLEKNLPSMVHERPFATASMALQRPFNCLGLDPCAHRKFPPIMVANTGVESHPDARIPEQHSTKIERPDGILATHGIRIHPHLRRK
jgi:hypothetical protein